MQSLAIVLLCILSAVVYGILHDQITARVCVEYFTIGHPPIFGTDDPTLLGLGWGVIATWWVGLMLGIPLAVAARAGSWPKRDVSSLIRPIVILVAVMAVCAFGAGVLGWLMASKGIVYLLWPLAAAVPAEKHAVFIADMWAHATSYLAGFVGGLVIIGRVCWWRWRMAASQGTGVRTPAPPTG